MNQIFKLALSVIVIFFGALPVMSQQTFYVYRSDGVVNQYLISNVTSIVQSKMGIDGIESSDYITQEIHTIDSISRIPLALIDSVSFSTPNPASSISEAYVNIDWNQTKLLACDPSSGNYSLSCKGEIPEIKEESVIVIETDTTSYIVLVTEVNKDGEKYDIKGELGDISYLFFDTEFKLTTESESPIQSSRKYLYASAATRRGVEFEDDGTIRATGNLWKNNGEEQVNDLYKKGNTHAYTKSKFGLNLDYEVSLRFGDKEETERGGKKFFAAKNLYVDANIKGAMDAYYDFYIDIEKGETTFDLAPNENDKYVLLKHKLFPTIPIKFFIGPVPVTIDLGADLFADVSLKGQGEFHFSAGIGANAATLIGARYDERNNNVVLYNEKPKLTITPHDPTVSGKGKVSGKVHIFPRVHAWIYGLAGPSFDIKPFVRADLSGGFQKDLLQNAPSDYCAWSLETFCGLDLAVGLSRSSWNYEVWNKSTKDLTAFEYNLYKSPVDMQFSSASPDEISKGKTTEVKFEVYDKGFDGNNVLTPLPQLVKFEGNGEINATVGQYGIVSSGIATASWIPASSSDTLSARLYDIDGNIIAEAQYFKEGICPDENHPHMIDLGLPSGTKWACCNIGASAPFESGSQYAWGETEEKSNYSASNYKFAQASTDGWLEINGILYNFINIGENICGTNYDVANVKWGSSWRMPSVTEMEELVNQCTWQLDSENGTYVYKVTGPNGASIVLPGYWLNYWTGNLNHEASYWWNNFEPIPYVLCSDPSPHVHSPVGSSSELGWFIAPYQGCNVRAVFDSNINATRKMVNTENSSVKSIDTDSVEKIVVISNEESEMTEYGKRTYVKVIRK